jgi:hypothetical protein
MIPSVVPGGTLVCILIRYPPLETVGYCLSSLTGLTSFEGNHSIILHFLSGCKPPTSALESRRFTNPIPRPALPLAEQEGYLSRAVELKQKSTVTMPNTAATPVNING